MDKVYEFFNRLNDWMERDPNLTAYVMLIVSLVVGYLVWFGWPF